MYSNFIEISETSNVPKYQQLCATLIKNIEEGTMKIGERVPSINDTSEEYYLSRDTVLKAYELLREKGILTAVKGRGFYVSCSPENREKKLLLLFSKLSDHKKTIYNAIAKHLPNNTKIDLQVHHSDSAALEKMIIENLGKYDYYIIMPQVRKETKSVISAINMIPKDKLLLINHNLAGIEGDYGCIYEDFETDIYNGLSSGIDKIQKYSKLCLLHPTTEYWSSGIRSGFQKFCINNKFDWEICCSIEKEIVPGELYIVIEESDLVGLLKQANAKNLKPGSDLGIISYNNSPFKEIIAGGISVLSTDFDKMGKCAAEMVINKSKTKTKNPFSFIVRKSI